MFVQAPIVFVLGRALLSQLFSKLCTFDVGDELERKVWCFGISRVKMRENAIITVWAAMSDS